MGELANFDVRRWNIQVCPNGSFVLITKTFVHILVHKGGLPNAKTCQHEIQVEVALNDGPAVTQNNDLM